jgi:hypothetical protein
MYINMAELKDHVAYHDALTALNFKDLPKNLKHLMDRRKNLIKTCSLKYLTDPDISAVNVSEWEHSIKQINSSFELIKSYLTLTFEENRKFKNELKVDVQGEYAEKVWLSNTQTLRRKKHLKPSIFQLVDLYLSFFPSSAASASVVSV